MLRPKTKTASRNKVQRSPSSLCVWRLSLQREEVDLSALTRELVSRMSEELVRVGSEVRLALDGAVTGQEVGRV